LKNEFSPNDSRETLVCISIFGDSSTKIVQRFQEKGNDAVCAGVNSQKFPGLQQ